MTAIQLRAELFREMNPWLDREDVLQRMLLFVRGLVHFENLKNDVTLDRIRTVTVKRKRQVPASFKKLRGIVSISDDEIANDEHLAHIMER